MCLFGSNKSSSTQTATPTYDPQTQALKNTAIAKASSLAEKVYQPTPAGQRVAGFSGDQNHAFNVIRSNALNYDPSTINRAVNSTEAAANAGPQKIKVEGLMDEGGRLGSIQSGMNPYLEQILNPALRQISEQGAIQRNGIKAGATSAGAFGDARHGVVEGMQMRDQGQQVADTTGQLYKSAWDDTMARRASDRDAFTAGDITNANFAETALGRLLSGSAQAVDLKAAGELLKDKSAQGLLTAGNQQQAQTQAGLDATQEEKLRQDESYYRQLDVLQSLISGSPTSQQVTTTTKDGSSGLTKVLGGALGALF